MPRKVETVEVTLKLPKSVYEFYRAFATFHRAKSVEDYLTKVVIEDIDGLVDNMSRRFVIKQFGLEDYSTIPVEPEEG